MYQLKPWLLSAVSILLLFVWGCGARAPQTPAPSPPAGGDEAAPMAKVEEALGAAGLEAGWGEATWQQVYPPGNMYEAINGEADLFLAYGCRGLAKARFASGEDKLEVEVFDMERPLDAFGVYSQLRIADGTPVEVEEAAQSITGEDILFWKSRYFVRLFSMSEDGPLALETMTKMARAVALQLEGASELPQWTAALQNDELIEGSLEYIKNDVLGYGYLTNGMLGRYRRVGTECELTLMRFARAAGAASARDKLMSAYQGAPISIAPLGEEAAGFKGTAPGGHPVWAGQAGLYLMVVSGECTEADALGLMGDVWSALEGE